MATDPEFLVHSQLPKKVEFRAINSVVECLAYIQVVGSSNLSSPIKEKIMDVDKITVNNAFALLDELIANAERGTLLGWFYGEEAIIHQTKNELQFALKEHKDMEEIL